MNEWMNEYFHKDVAEPGHSLHVPLGPQTTGLKTSDELQLYLTIAATDLSLRETK